MVGGVRGDENDGSRRSARVPSSPGRPRRHALQPGAGRRGAGGGDGPRSPLVHLGLEQIDTPPARPRSCSGITAEVGPIDQSSLSAPGPSLSAPGTAWLPPGPARSARGLLALQYSGAAAARAQLEFHRPPRGKHGNELNNNGL